MVMPEKNKKPKIIKLSSRLVQLSTDFNWYVIPIDAKSASGLRFEKNNRRIICTIKSSAASETIQCALMPFGGNFFVMVNKQVRTRLGIKEGDKVTVEFQKDESKYGLPMSKELREVLRQDKEGNHLFHSLTPGRQRSIIYYVGKIKDIDRRIAAALIFVEHLKKNNGRINQETLKNELKRPLTI